MDCLVTKLKASVNNDELIALGEIKFSIDCTSAPSITNGVRITISTNSEVSLRTTGTFSGTIPATINGLDKTITITSGAGNLFISRKEAITKVSIDAEYCYVRQSHFDYMPVLEEVRLPIFSIMEMRDTLSTCPNIELFSVAYIYGHNISINISDIKDFAGVTFWNFDVGGVRVEGDVSLLANNVTYLLTNLTNSSLLWGTTRASEAYIMSLSGDYGNDLDAMLINQANCTLAQSYVSAKSVNVSGTRTSASDTAVATLKSRGFTVTVNGTVL